MQNSKWAGLKFGQDLPVTTIYWFLHEMRCRSAIDLKERSSPVVNACTSVCRICRSGHQPQLDPGPIYFRQEKKKKIEITTHIPRNTAHIWSSFGQAQVGLGLVQTRSILVKSKSRTLARSILYLITTRLILGPVACGSDQIPNSGLDNKQARPGSLNRRLNELGLELIFRIEIWQPGQALARLSEPDGSTNFPSVT